MDKNSKFHKMSYIQQMCNVGSEVSRAIRWKNTGKNDRVKNFADFALNLLHIMLEETKNQDKRAKIEYDIAVLKDFFFDENKMESTDKDLIEYYDSFLLLE